MSWLSRIFKRKKVQNCLNCKFNLGETCGVGTVYAEKGINAICYEGELWKELGLTLTQTAKQEVL